MSARALKLAVRDHLRQKFGWDELHCAITYFGQPVQNAGKFFVGIWDGPWQGHDRAGTSRDDTYGINVTVTVRIEGVPYDREGTELETKEADGLDALCEKIVSAIHVDPSGYDIVNRANEIIGTGANGFVEPLIFFSGGQPEPKGGPWFRANQKDQRAGIAQTVAFGQARRVQTIESQT